MKIHSMVKIKAEKGEWCLLLSKEVFPDRGLFEQRSEGGERSEPWECFENECSRQREWQMQSPKARSCLMSSQRTSGRRMGWNRVALLQFHDRSICICIAYLYPSDG